MVNRSGFSSATVAQDTLGQPVGFYSKSVRLRPRPVTNWDRRWTCYLSRTGDSSAGTLTAPSLVSGLPTDLPGTEPTDPGVAVGL